MKSSLLYSFWIWLASTLIGPALYMIVLWATGPFELKFDVLDGVISFYLVVLFFSLFFSWVGFLFILASNRYVRKLESSLLSRKLFMAFFGVCSTAAVFIVADIVTSDDSFFSWELIVPFSIPVVIWTLVKDPGMDQQ